MLLVGSTRPFEVLVLREDGTSEALGTADAATVAVHDDPDDPSIFPERRTADSNLSIDAANGKLVATLLQAEADALVPGDYVGDAAIRFQPGDRWEHVDPFPVRVVRTRSTRTA